jgi:hypothetical protein
VQIRRRRTVIREEKENIADIVESKGRLDWWKRCEGEGEGGRNLLARERWVGVLLVQWKQLPVSRSGVAEDGQGKDMWAGGSVFCFSLKPNRVQG